MAILIQLRLIQHRGAGTCILDGSAKTISFPVESSFSRLDTENDDRYF